MTDMIDQALGIEGGDENSPCRGLYQAGHRLGRVFQHGLA